MDNENGLKQEKTKAKNRGAFKMTNEKLTKIFGIAIILFSAYLLIAFTSYFISWKEDQDKILKFSTNILFDNSITVKNWLGRLGALVSNAFIYWGFGVASILFVAVFFKLGLVVLFKKSKEKFYIFFTQIIYIVSFISVTLSFIFKNSEFSWGGAFGSSVNIWLVNFLGNIGMFLLLLFLVVTVLVWYFNPKFESMHFSLGDMNLKFPVVFFKNGVDVKSIFRKSFDSREESDTDFDEVSNKINEEEHKNGVIDLDFENKDKANNEIQNNELDSKLDMEIENESELDAESEKMILEGNNNQVNSDLIPKDDFDTIKV
ncbi:MAG: DNA translocase FtsK 4TM domain-containing protein, partial [Saprospiraceae bacterium]